MIRLYPISFLSIDLIVNWHWCHNSVDFDSLCLSKPYVTKNNYFILKSICFKFW